MSRVNAPLIFDRIDCDHETVALCRSGHADEEALFKNFIAYRSGRHLVAIRRGDKSVAFTETYETAEQAADALAAIDPMRGSVK